MLNLVAFCQNAPQQCPTIAVSGPAGMTHPGENINVSAKVTPAIQNLKYFWHASAGTITKDQGTSAISLATTSDDNFSEIVVRVEIEGVPNGCPQSASAKFGVSNGIFDVFSIEEFQWKVSRLDEGVRLDNLAIQLNKRGESNLAYIVLRTEKSRKVLEQRIKRMKQWLFNKRKFPNKARYVFLLERSDRDEITFWLLPTQYHICETTCVQIP